MGAIQKVRLPILFSAMSWQAWTQLLHTTGDIKIPGIVKNCYLK